MKQATLPLSITTEVATKHTPARGADQFVPIVDQNHSTKTEVKV